MQAECPGGSGSFSTVKLSFLLPTRDRLDYLKLAIETVRRQDDHDWEIVVSDNASTDDIGGYLEDLRDERIVYRRAAQALNVTDNWNAALALASGDYVLMLGDDDGLTPGYIAHARKLIAQFEQPDLVHTGALLFTYPGVDRNHPDGSLSPFVNAALFADATAPFAVTRERALAAVRSVMSFRLAFTFNMQLSLMSRRLIDELRGYGEVFQSAFPDYYATTAAFIVAQKIVADPSTPVVIGVTPKSYGYFHLNVREDEGREMLGDQAERTLPGTNINDGWLSAMRAIEARFGARYGLRVNMRRYRFLQAVSVYSARYRGHADSAEVARLEAALPPLERIAYHTADLIARGLVRVLPAGLWKRLMRRGQGQFPRQQQELSEGRYRDLLEVFEDRLETSASGVRN
jgi:glycosyltransferase involved in cell wall biosynthesis